MKKSIIMLFATLMMALTFSGCIGCNGKQVAPVAPQPAEEIAEAQLNPEHIAAVDKQYMYLHYGDNYRFYEQCILLNDFLDEECDGSIEGISNVFQAITSISEDEKTFDTEVVIIAHKGEAAGVETKHAFWVEDCPLNNEAIKITYEQAFQLAMAVNYPKPHSKNCILRKPVGPKDCNPQYVFGNLKYQIWIDAVTGEAHDSNPAFEGVASFSTPLGEWP